MIWYNTRERTTELEIDRIQQARYADTNTVKPAYKNVGFKNLLG